MHFLVAMHFMQIVQQVRKKTKEMSALSLTEKKIKIFYADNYIQHGKY